MTTLTDLLSDLLSDLRYALRTLLRAPAFAAVAVAALTLGIGANSAIFTVVRAVLLRPLPYATPGRLVRIRQRFSASNGGGPLGVSVPEYVAYRDQSRAFEGVGAYYETGFNLTDADAGRVPERVDGAVATSSFFAALGVRPLLGRAFTAEDEREGAPRVALLSYGLWRRRFGGDPRAVGSTYQSSGRPVTVVGVMPPEFAVGTAELWRPLGFTARDLADRAQHFLTVTARLRPGVTVEQATRDVRRVAALGPGGGMPSDLIWVSPLAREVVGGVRPVLLVLLGAVGLVLLIACANVANLLLSRGAARQREVAVRTALGASRGRLVRQLLAESAVLSLAGALAGLLLALWAVRLLVLLRPGDLPRMDAVRVDAGVLAFTLALSLATALVFGLAPALQASQVSPHDALKEGGARAAGGRRHQRLRRALAAGELALSLVLLVGAGLLVRTVVRLAAVDVGIREPGRLLVAQTSLPFAKYGGPAQQLAFAGELLRRLSAAPGVGSAAVTSALPFSGQHASSSMYIAGRARPEQGFPEVYVTAVTPDYFRTIGIALRRGRLLADGDRAESPAVVVINQTLARQWWPTESPIGRRVAVFSPEDNPAWREVVGVVADTRNDGLTSPPHGEIYAPFAQMTRADMGLVLRASCPDDSACDAAPLVGLLRAELRAVDASQPLFGVSTLARKMADSIARQRFAMLLLVAFAAVAVLLAAVGVYGVIAYAVAQQAREIGIRRALGAQEGEVARMVLRQGARVTLVGLALGVAGALLVTRVLERLLFGVRPTDPLTFAGVSALLAAVAMVATYLPARRAMKVDPIVALRGE